jgi:hypothetical protein
MRPTAPTHEPSTSGIVSSDLPGPFTRLAAVPRLETLAEVAVRRVPVLDGDTLVGMVPVGDVTWLWNGTRPLRSRTSPMPSRTADPPDAVVRRPRPGRPGTPR